jgi:hypothetical protein
MGLLRKKDHIKAPYTNQLLCSVVILTYQDSHISKMQKNYVHACCERLRYTV